jgi:hypothetical protein
MGGGVGTESAEFLQRFSFFFYVVYRLPNYRVVDLMV